MWLGTAPRTLGFLVFDFGREPLLRRCPYEARPVRASRPREFKVRSVVELEAVA